MRFVLLVLPTEGGRAAEPRMKGNGVASSKFKAQQSS